MTEDCIWQCQAAFSDDKHEGVLSPLSDDTPLTAGGPDSPQCQASPLSLNICKTIVTWCHPSEFPALHTSSHSRPRDQLRENTNLLISDGHYRPIVLQLGNEYGQI